MNKFSLNNRFILAPYQSDNQIKSTTGGGFAMIQQKVNLIGLTILVDVQTDKQSTSSLDTVSHSGPAMIPRGYKAYIREELLFTQPWAKKILECDGIEGKFIIVEQQYVEFVSAR